jgi:hypothetical protein
MATRNAAIIVDADLAAAYNAAPKIAQKKIQTTLRQMLQTTALKGKTSGAAPATTQPPQFSAHESRLLLTINRGLNAQQCQRITELTDKMEYASITDAEHAELMRLSQAAEKLHAARLKAMIKLAELRGISFDELLKQLGIEAH